MSEFRRGLRAAFPGLRRLASFGRPVDGRALATVLAAPEAPPAPPAPPPLEEDPDLSALARGLEDGAPCPEPLLAALAVKVALRRARTDTAEGPASPRTSDLSVRRTGLPDWWEAGENLLLAGPDIQLPELKPNMMYGPPRRAVVVLGARSIFHHFNLGLDDLLVVIGDDANCRVGALSCTGASTVLIGEAATATNWAQFDCRNGGMILVGPDAMWAHGINFMTDDTHAIRDVATGRRLNTYGGCIVIERHVWLGESVRVLGGARIGEGAIVGMGALVKNAVLPPNSVSVGVPARTVRSGVTWSREDLP